jgi:hypothetical protein
MSEAVTEVKPETVQQVWERTTRVPITKEQVRGKDPNPEPARAPDRALITPEVVKLLQAKKAKPVDPIEERLAGIERSLAPEPPVQKLSEAQELLQTLREVRDRELRRVEQEEQDAYEKQVAAFRSAAEQALVDQKEKYPGLVRANLTGKVIETLVDRIERGEVASDDEIASKAEADLRAFYLELHEVYGSPTQAKTQPSSEETKPQTSTKTLTGSLVGGDSALSSEELYLKYGKEGATAAWDRTMKVTQ